MYEVTVCFQENILQQYDSMKVFILWQYKNILSPCINLSSAFSIIYNYLFYNNLSSEFSLGTIFNSPNILGIIFNSPNVLGTIDNTEKKCIKCQWAIFFINACTDIYGIYVSAKQRNQIFLGIPNPFREFGEFLKWIFSKSNLTEPNLILIILT